MYSFGLACLGQTEPAHFAPDQFPFAVDVMVGVESHRRSDSPFAPVFQLLSGVTYHLGTWHNEDYFSARDILELDDNRGPGHRPRLRVRPELKRPVHYVLSRLIQESPSHRVLLFVDQQGLPPAIRPVPAMTTSAFWEHHGRRGLIGRWTPSHFLARGLSRYYRRLAAAWGHGSQGATRIVAVGPGGPFGSYPSSIMST
jgi:hypothetical protein